MSCLGNVIWFLLGGIWMGLSWWFVGVLCFISIVGIPWGRACFVIGQFAFFPFGKMPVSREVLTGQQDIGTGPFGTLGNIIWLLLAGIWIAMEHLVWALLCAVTIIGIPFALQTIKLGLLCLWPFGSTVRETDSPTGCIRVPLNIIWLICGGLWACLQHLLFGFLLCITIIGIPWGKQHFKMAGLSLAPFGKDVELAL